jgi:NitT/TauT family transport system permease protein
MKQKVRIIDTPNASLVPTRGQQESVRAIAAARSVLFTVLVLASIAFVWQGAITLFHVKPFVAPTPLSVVTALNTDWTKLATALGYTLRSTFVGLALSCCVALILATLFTLSEGLARTLMPLIIAIRTAPVLAIAPLLILMFGRGAATSIAVVVIVCFFPIMINAAKGFQSTDRSALELMHVLGATWLGTFFKVRVPFAFPHIFVGLRTAATGGLLSAMLAEWLSGSPGLGTLILEAGSSRKLPLMWAGVVLAMAIAFTVFTFTVCMERRFTK